jgi:hypothetical protein
VKHLLSLLLLLFAFAVGAQAQDDLPPPTSKPGGRNEAPTMPDEDFQGFKPKKKIDLSKFIIEPNFNLSFGQGRIDFGIAPYVGYQVFEQKKGAAEGLYVGGGFTYFYTGFRNLRFTDGTGRSYTANANWHTYGGGVFVQYNVWRGFFARVKMEVLHRSLDDFYNGGVNVVVNPVNGSYKVNIPKVEKTIPALLIGGGYNLTRSKNFFLPLMVSYNVLHNVTDRNYSLYPRGVVVQLGFINIF